MVFSSSLCGSFAACVASGFALGGAAACAAVGAGGGAACALAESDAAGLDELDPHATTSGNTRAKAVALCMCAAF